LAEDTDPKVEQIQIDRWRQMTPNEKLAIVSGMTRTVIERARAIRQRHPHASPREQALRLAIVTLGGDLATKVYPEIADWETD
jgi:hypothetical protein